MPVKPILEYPDPRLRQSAHAVTEFNASLLQLSQDLIDTLHDSTGIGLCAPQIGSDLQVLAIRESEEPQAVEVLVNPRILRTAVPCIVEEQCLSLPGLVGKVLRSAEVELVCQTVTGAEVERRLSGMAAVCLQHELEHLQGVLFLDHLSAFKRWRYRKWGAHRSETTVAAELSR